MRFAEGQLSALAAVIREGSFERAARVLHVTPSAVSQRVKQLEESLGAILVVRGSPCTATPTGHALYRHAEQIELLERDLLRTIAPEQGSASAAATLVTIAVNADSLATWLVPALADFTASSGARVDIVVDDEGSTPDWLRSGRVLGAVTSEARPIQGCRVRPLGVMRYLATASRDFVARFCPGKVTAAALERAPALSYDRKDRLAERFLREVLGGRAEALLAHFMPSPNAYVEATVRGLGWGMNPEPLVAGLVARKRLVDLGAGQWLEVPLFWQQWALASPTLDALSRALSTSATTSLHAPPETKA